MKDSAGEGAYQSELVRKSGFSRSRVSEVLSNLERKDIVSRSSLGKNLRVDLRAFNAKGIKGKKSTSSKNNRLRLGFIAAAEYPFVIPFKKLLRENLGITLDLEVYENGIDLSRDLSLLRLDLGIAPALTHFMYYSLGAPIKIIAPAGSGGSSVIVRKKKERTRIERSSGGEEENSGLGVATTKLSTMELLLRSSINEDLLSDEVTRVVYSSNPESMMNVVATGRVDAACLWEPYATILLAKKSNAVKRLARYSDIGEHICCALAAGNHLKDSLVCKLVSLFESSINEYHKNSEALFGPYSALVGFDEKIMRQVSSEYSYPLELDPKKISKQFEVAGVQIPDPASIKDSMRITA